MTCLSGVLTSEPNYQFWLLSKVSMYMQYLDQLDQVWSILPASSRSGRMTSRGEAPPMEAKWIKLDLYIAHHFTLVENAENL